MSLTRPAAGGESCFAGFFFAATAAGVRRSAEPPCAITSANHPQRLLFQTVVRSKTTPARNRGGSHGRCSRGFSGSSRGIGLFYPESARWRTRRKKCRSYRSVRAPLLAKALKSGRRGRSDRRSRRSGTSTKKYGRSVFCPDGAALLRRIQGFRGTSRGCRILKNLYTIFSWK